MGAKSNINTLFGLLRRATAYQCASTRRSVIWSLLDVNGHLKIVFVCEEMAFQTNVCDAISRATGDIGKSFFFWFLMSLSIILCLIIEHGRLDELTKPSSL